MSFQTVPAADALSAIAGKPAFVPHWKELVMELESFPMVTMGESDTAKKVVVYERSVEMKEGFFLSSSLPSEKSSTTEEPGEAVTPLPTRLQRSSSQGLLKRHDSDSLDRRRRTNIRMRLPSFKALGISSLDPEYSSATRHRHRNTTPAASSSEVSNRRLSSRAQSSPSPDPQPPYGSTPLLTPPEDINSIKWNNALLHPPHSDARQPPCAVHNNSFTTKSVMSASGADGNISNMTQLDQRPSQADERPNQPPFDSRGGQADEEPSTWLGQGIQASVSSITGADAQQQTINVVAQMLPRPAQDPASSISVFTSVVQAIQGRFEGSRQPYITITHAVPPKFELVSLPTSPPATPNLVHAGEDYFSQSIFAHAAVVPSYHASHGGLNTLSATSPNPIVPPSSVHVSILERYIPPTSTREYQDLFSGSGHSVLVDRLSELSPSGGTLLFIYPTKKGAKSFANEYLGPVLDPILMHIVSLNELSYDLAESIGRMKALPNMHDFGIMKSKMASVCNIMSQRATPGDRHSRFSLVYAGKGNITLDKDTWTEWFIQQEHARIKDTLNAYWQRAQRLPTDKDTTAMTIARQIVDGVRKARERDGGVGAGKEIEVGTFVIRRSSASA